MVSELINLQQFFLPTVATCTPRRNQHRVLLVRSETEDNKWLEKPRQRPSVLKPLQRNNHATEKTPNFIYKQEANIDCLQTAGVVECFQGPKVPPCWRQTVLQEPATALTRRLEQFDVAAEPRLWTDRWDRDR